MTQEEIEIIYSLENLDRKTRIDIVRLIEIVEQRSHEDCAKIADILMNEYEEEFKIKVDPMSAGGAMAAARVALEIRNRSLGDRTGLSTQLVGDRGEKCPQS